MESSDQKHVVGIPVTSFAFAEEKTQGKPSCSALIPKKSNNLTPFFLISLFQTPILCMPILTSYPLHCTDKKSSFIHQVSKLSHKTDSYMQGFKEHCKNSSIVLFLTDASRAMLVRHKSSSSTNIFFFCSDSGIKTFRNYQRKIKIWCKGAPSWQH
jgi:hypothetical protein